MSGEHGTQDVIATLAMWDVHYAMSDDKVTR